MKPWLDLSTVPMPKRIAALRRDSRGYPIPHTVFWRGDEPDFKCIDPHKWAHAAQYRRCGICGEAMGARVAFVGGPRSIAARQFTDLGMHLDCAEYSLRVCPMLAAPKFSYARAHPEDTVVLTGVSDQRPDKFGLGITKGYTAHVYLDGLILKAGPWVSVTWWRHGVVVE